MFPNFNFRFGQDKPVDTRNRFFQNIFPPPQEEDPFDRVSLEGNEVAPTQPGFMEVYKELMSKQNGPTMSAYRKFVEQGAPTRETTPINKMTRLGAILSGAAAGFQNPASGVDVTTSILDRPFQDRMRDYTNQGSRLRELASLEQDEHKGNIASVRAVGEMQDKQADNARQDALAASLIKQRALTMKETEQRIQANGASFHLDKTSGIGYLVKRDGTRTPVGTFDQSSGERLAEDITKLKTSSDLTLGRQKTMSGIEFGQRKTLQEDSQAHAKELEATRQSNRKELTVERARLAAENAAKRAKLTNPSELNNIRKNLTAVNAIVDADPGKYEDFWDGESLGAIPSTEDTEAYAAYVELYNALYKGTSALNPKVTKSGNAIIRD